jgi:Fusaric acid resistance protein-like
VTPGGEFGYRASRMGLFAVIGALLTGLGFAIGEKAWELVVLAAFVVTVLGGLAVKYGLHRYMAGYVLNCWFIIAIGLPASYKLDRYTSHTWAQMLAWVAGCALWVAIAFGLHLPNAYWMPIATIVAMKSSLDQSALVAAQRLIGATIGAAIASLCLLAIHSKYALEVILVLLGAIGASIRGVNYTLYAAAIAGCVLIASGVSHHPSNLGAEAERVLYTFLGIGLALIVMLLVSQLQKRTAAKATPQPT